MWGWVWTLLILAGLAFLGWTAWNLVRAGMRVLRAAGQAGQQLSAVSGRAEVLLAEAESRRADTGPSMFDDPVTLRARVRERRERRHARRARRYGSWQAVWQVWGRGTWLERRQAARRGVR